MTKKELIESAYRARYLYQLNVHYVIKKPEPQPKNKNQGEIQIEEEFNEKIEIIDVENTGEIKKNSRWSMYLHEFLELKHFIKVSKTRSMVYKKATIGFFDSYGP